MKKYNSNVNEFGDYGCYKHKNVLYNYYCPKCYPNKVKITEKIDFLVNKIINKTLKNSSKNEIEKVETELNNILLKEVKKLGTIDACKFYGLNIKHTSAKFGFYEKSEV